MSTRAGPSAPRGSGRRLDRNAASAYSGTQRKAGAHATERDGPVRPLDGGMGIVKDRQRPGGGDAGPEGDSIGVGGWLLRAAALVLVLAGIFSLVPPLRAWLLDGVPGSAGEPEEVVSGPPMLPEPDTLTADSLVLRFDSFEFELTADQRNGSVRVRVEDTGTASVQIHTRTGLESFYRIPGGMRIINQGGSVADYEIILPRTVRAVRLFMGGRGIADYIPRGEGNTDRTFQLIEFAR